MLPFIIYFIICSRTNWNVSFMGKLCMIQLFSYIMVPHPVDTDKLEFHEVVIVCTSFEKKTPKRKNLACRIFLCLLLDMTNAPQALFYSSLSIWHKHHFYLIQFYLMMDAIYTVLMTPYEVGLIPYVNIFQGFIKIMLGIVLWAILNKFSNCRKRKQQRTRTWIRQTC